MPRKLYRALAPPAQKRVAAELRASFELNGSLQLFQQQSNNAWSHIGISVERRFRLAADIVASDLHVYSPTRNDSYEKLLKYEKNLLWPT